MLVRRAFSDALFYFTRSLLVWLSYRDLVICWAHSPEIGEPVVIGSVEDPERKVREWLLLLLRFAVTRDVPDFALVAGVPARQIGWVGHAGVRLDAAGSGRWRCPQTGSLYTEENGVLRDAGEAGEEARSPR